METKTVDVYLKDEGDFVTIGFQTKKAQEILSNDNVLKKLYYCITEDKLNITNVQGNVPKVDFPIDGIIYIKKFLDVNNLTYEEC